MFNILGSWFVGTCSTTGCNQQQMVRTTQNAPHFERGWCYVCKHYTIEWGWLRVNSADVTDGNSPIVKD